MFKYLIGTSGKFITLGICIFLYFQLNMIYEKMRGTLEGVLAKGQVSSDNMAYFWAKLLSEGMLINLVNWLVYLIIFCIVLRICGTVYTNRIAFKEMNKLTKRNRFF